MTLPHTLWLPNTRKHLIPRIDHGALETVKFLVIHINQGTTEGTFSWWAKPGHEADGAQVQVSQDGTVYQTVALNRKTWHAGSANPVSIGIEHEGFLPGTKDVPERLTHRPQVQLHASANRVGWLCHECDLGRPVLNKNVFGHGHGGAAWGNHPSCPGSTWPWVQYMRLCLAAYMEHWGR